MLSLQHVFVNLLVLKGLASERPPIDRQRTDPQIGLRYSPCHPYQPDLRILTRSTGGSPSRDLARRRFLRSRVSHSQSYSPHDGEGRSALPSFRYSPATCATSRQDAWDFAEKVFWDMAVVPGVIAPWEVFSRQVIYIFTIFGAEHEQWDLAIYLNRFIFPAVFFIGLAAVAAAILNSFHVFAIPAATSIFFNLVFILFSFRCVSADSAVRLPIFRRPPSPWPREFCGRSGAVGHSNSRAGEAGNEIPCRFPSAIPA